MYHVPDQSDPIVFGDVFSSDWLFDAFLNHDAVALRPVQMKGGAVGYAPVPTHGAQSSNALVLAHGESCRAILLSDDCEIETCLVRREGRGRLTFAAVTPWPTDPGEATDAEKMTTFRRHPLIPADGFEGGIAELFRLFAVTGTAVLGNSGRLLGLHDDARARLEQRWAAFATRRGPLAAAENATKLAHMLDALGNPGRIEYLVNGDAMPGESAIGAARDVARAMLQGWRVEGEVMQRVAAAHEARKDASEEVAALEDELRQLSEYAARAAEQLRSEIRGEH